MFILWLISTLIFLSQLTVDPRYWNSLTFLYFFVYYNRTIICLRKQLTTYIKKCALSVSYYFHMIISVILWINLFRLIIAEYTLNMESVPAWLTIGDSNIGSVSRTNICSEAKSANVDQPPRCVSIRRGFHPERSLSAKMGQTLICSHEVVPHLRSQLPLL